jgi:membrane-associated phospholipid phosphatase
MGASLMLGTLVCYYQQFLIPNILILVGVVLLGGVIMASRYLLGKHTLTQLISGYLVGLFISVITITLIQKFI